jgi:hypothetical protein
MGVGEGEHEHGHDCDNEAAQHEGGHVHLLGKFLQEEGVEYAETERDEAADEDGVDVGEEKEAAADVDRVVELIFHYWVYGDAETADRG